MGPLDASGVDNIWHTVAGIGLLHDLHHMVRLLSVGQLVREHASTGHIDHRRQVHLFPCTPPRPAPAKQAL